MEPRKDLDLVKLAGNEQVNALADQLANPTQATWWKWPEQFAAVVTIGSSVCRLKIHATDPE